MIYNDDIEKACLYSGLMNKSAMLILIDKVMPEDFYSEANRIFFKALLYLYKNKKEISSLSIKHELEKRDLFDGFGGDIYLKDIQQSSAISNHIESYVRDLLDYSSRRKIKHAAQDALEKVESHEFNVNELIGDLTRKFGDITEDKKDNYFDIKKFTDYETLINKDDYVSTGFKTLDKYMHGFFNSELTIIGARPGTGKTAFGLNIAEAVSAVRPVIFFSAEMPTQSLLIRMLSKQARMPYMQIKTGRISTDEQNRLKKAVETINKLNIKFDDTPALNIDKMFIKIEKYSRDEKPGLVIVDYLQLLSAGIRGSLYEKITYIAQQLKNHARRADVPVVALSQLSRAVESREKARPRLSDLRESGAIEQNADGVMFLYDEDKIEDSVNFSIEKLRNGRTAAGERLIYEKRYNVFSDL